MIILPDTELANACKAAERIRKTVEAKTDITVSLGISSYQQGMQRTEDLIKKADDALYQAKQKGRNRTEISN